MKGARARDQGQGKGARGQGGARGARGARGAMEAREAREARGARGARGAREARGARGGKGRKGGKGGTGEIGGSGGFTPGTRPKPRDGELKVNTRESVPQHASGGGLVCWEVLTHSLLEHTMCPTRF